MPNYLNSATLSLFKSAFINVKFILIYPFLTTYCILFDSDTFWTKFLSKSNLSFWTNKKQTNKKNQEFVLKTDFISMYFSWAFATLPIFSKIEGWLKENRRDIRTLSSL